MKVLVTGGCGFVGSNLAKHFKTLPWVTRVTVFDNLHRRGSELNVPILKQLGIEFVHGDVRNKEDLSTLPSHDILIEASAEPSVHAGKDDPSYVIGSNLIGVINCLEYARKYNSIFIFLSSSRVYSINKIRTIVDQLSSPSDLRLEPSSFPHYAINEQFPTQGPRSIYGTTKLAAELLVEEYHHSYGLRTVINRCGIIAGPGQFGKTDQGVITLWMAAHTYGFPLTYKGFGGHGSQVRDVLAADDLGGLIELEVDRLNDCNGRLFNIGGGEDNTVSLLELTRLCEDISGNSMAQIAEDPTTNPVDIPWYVSDCGLVSATLGWKPNTSINSILTDTHKWLVDNETTLKPLFLEGSK